MNDENKEDPLVRRLEAIAQEDDRATLAALRASLRQDRALDALRVVLPFIRVRAEASEAERLRRERDACLVAGLFAMHPQSADRSLASVLGQIARESPSDSIEMRMRALLSASREDLDDHLRRAVALVAAKGFGIDWADLHRALQWWDHEDDWVRRAWARDFWGWAQTQEETQNDDAENGAVPQAITHTPEEAER
jgi:CRISPR type I-E-associated protein CasB/Cse2